METLKLTFVCLATSFLAISCTDTTESGDYYSEEIRFSTASEIPQTRALPVLSSNDIPDMGVYAYYTGNGTANNWDARGATATPGFMNNIQINHNGGVWSYDDPMHWPQAADANVSFFAYSPFATTDNGIAMNVSTGIPSITYNVPVNCSDQPDLMVSALLQDRNKSNNGSLPVNFQMKHALTCLGFKASGNGERITKITAKGVKTSGILTVQADGTPSWDTSAAGNGNFEATVDDGVYLESLAQLVNTGGGYLMMIPQTLETGAGITIELNSGRSFDFDLEGTTWQAGQFINYNLSVTPEAVLLFTPEKIVLPPKGGFSEFNVTVGNGSNLDWAISSSNPGFVICDNLNDILSWASGTTPAANVRNTDGTTPGTQFTGTGSKTLYVWKATPNVSTTAEITGTISNVIDPAGVSINVVQLPDYAMATVRNNYMSGEYAGVFWRANQRGERIIRIPVTATVRAGEWDASVYWLGAGWKAGDIVFSTDDSEDTGITFNSTTENPADMNSNDAAYRIPGYVSSASGNAVSGAGNYIEFRIGLSSFFSPTTAMPARYALVVLRYGTPQKFHAIFIRQGDDPDYVMSPGDNSLPRTAAARFSPYNTTDSKLNDISEFLVDVGPAYGNSEFTKYPSQAGAFYQWANDPNPVAYHPVKPVKPHLWLGALTGKYWSMVSSAQESCPSGYHRPSDGITNWAAANTSTTGIESSEIRQSLYVTPTMGSSVSSVNFRWGYYADGFFDRRDHNNPDIPSPGLGGSAIKANTAASWRTKDVAYIGVLIFNPTAGNSRENASLFIPAAGSRHADTGALIEAGEVATFLSSSSPDTDQMWYYVGTEVSSYQLNSTRRHGLSQRSVRN